jgi:hypothetical protein
LFSGVAGTLAAAQDGELAAFVVHEFATELTTEKKRVVNRTALAEFVGDVTGAVAPDEDWWLPARSTRRPSDGRRPPTT